MTRQIEYVSSGMSDCCSLVTPGFSETDLYKRTMAGEYVRDKQLHGQQSWLLGKKIGKSRDIRS